MTEFREKINRIIKNITPSAVARIGAMLLLCIYPLFVKHAYTEMTQAKACFFIIISLATFMVVHFQLTLKGKNNGLLRIDDKTDIALLCFLGCAVVSCIISSNPLYSIIGSSGRFMGLITIIAELAIFFALSKTFRPKEWVFRAFAISSLFMNIFALLQFMGYNPLGFYTGYSQWTIDNFISMLGNSNVYSSYICLTMPFFMYMGAKSEKLVDRILYTSAQFFTFMGIFMSMSDGAYIGLAVSFLIVMFALRKDFRARVSFIHSIILFFLAIGAVSFIANCGYFPDMKEISYIASFAIYPVFWAGGLALATVIYVIEKFVPKMDKPSEVMFIIMIVVVILMFAVGFGALIYFSFIDKDTDLGAFGKYFRFSDKWGTSRGLIWRSVWETFCDFSFIHKLFGCGIEELQSAIIAHFGENITVDGGMTVDNAHNEYLQYLATQGILGLGSYLVFIVFAVRKGIKSKEKYCTASVLAALSFLAQASVNLLQALTSPFVFILLAIACSADAKALPAAAETESEEEAAPDGTAENNAAEETDETAAAEE